MTRDREVAVTREGAVGALKLLMIVLAAIIFWESASAVNKEFHERGLTTAPPFLRGAASLLIGTETTAPVQQRFRDFWRGNHRLIGLIAVMASAVVLCTRYLMLGRVLDYLYLESSVRDKRIYSGFVANIFLVLVHAAIIYGIVLVARDYHASFVPVTLLAFFLFNLLWSAGMFMAARPIERHSLRGLRYLALTAAVAAVVLFYATWLAESVQDADEAMRGSRVMVLSAAIALAACITDAIVQNFVYCRRVRPASPVPA